MKQSADVLKTALLSSNARPKYFEDCLRTLMLPRGMVQHFRYRSKYIAPAILTSIGSKAIIGQSVVVCYLSQNLDVSKNLVPVKVRPIRLGIVRDVQVVGSSVHLYFEVMGYPANGDAGGAIASAVARGHTQDNGAYFVAESAGLTTEQFSSENGDASAFAETVEAFEATDLRMFTEFKGALVDCDPLFVRIDGLYQRTKTDATKLLAPSSKAPFSVRDPGYILRSDDSLELRVQFQQPAWSKVDSLGMYLTLKTDPEDFGNPETDRFDIASPYDQKDFYLMPLRSNAVWLSRIELETAGAPEQFTVDTSQRRLIATPFNALVSGTSVYPRWLYVAANATTNTAAMLTSIVSIILALFLKSSAASSTNAPNSYLIAGVIIGLCVITALALVASVVRSRAK